MADVDIMDDEINLIRQLASTREAQLEDVSAALYAKIEALQYGLEAFGDVQNVHEFFSQAEVNVASRISTDKKEVSVRSKSLLKRLEKSTESCLLRLSRLIDEAESTSARHLENYKPFTSQVAPIMLGDHARRIEVLVDRVRDKCTRELGHELAYSFGLEGASVCLCQDESTLRSLLQDDIVSPVISALYQDIHEELANAIRTTLIDEWSAVIDGLRDRREDESVLVEEGSSSLERVLVKCKSQLSAYEGIIDRVDKENLVDGQKRNVEVDQLLMRVSELEEMLSTAAGNPLPQASFETKGRPQPGLPEVPALRSPFGVISPPAKLLDPRATVTRSPCFRKPLCEACIVTFRYPLQTSEKFQPVNCSKSV